MSKKNTTSEPKTWYRILGKKNNETRIDIMSEIGFWGITAEQFRNDLKGIGEDEPIHVHINSDGGDILEGNEIYNALVEHKGRVRVSIGAIAASMASVIAMAGDEISIAENGFIMIHNPWTMALGDAEEMRKVADVLDKLKNNIINAYRKQTTKTVDEISSMMDEETWMTAEEALANGFVDKIETLDEESDESASNLDLSRFSNSLKFLSRLTLQNLKGTVVGDRRFAVVGKRGKVTVKDLQEANTPQPESSSDDHPADELVGPQNNKEDKKQMKSIESADPAAPVSPEAQAAEIKKKADELYRAKLKRDQEIDDIVVAVRTRDKKDFADLALRFKQEDKSADEFARAIVTSKEFKQFEVVGSGIEVVEPLDSLKGSPGFYVVTNEAYKALAEIIKTRGRGSLPQKTQLMVDTCQTLRQYLNRVGRFMDAPGPPTSTGLTSIEKLPGIVELGVRRLTIKDLIAAGATSNTTIRYIREVSFNNSAATVAEGAAKPAALFEYQEVDAPVRKIAAYVKVTDELFADYLAMASYINQRLPYMVERTAEDQILNGNGVGQNLTGILQTSGIQTQAKGADTAADALFKALTLVRFTGFFEPDGFVFHPTDWQNLRLAKDSAGQYFGGGPFTGAYGSSPLVQYDSYWGKPAVITPAIPVGTALCGAFKLGAQYFQREGLTIDMTNSDQDDFIKNLMTILAEERLALAVYRPLAFCQVTGL